MEMPQFAPHHIALSVLALEDSLRFYGHFGFKPLLRWRAPDGELEISHLGLGSLILELFCFNDSSPAPESAASLGTDLPRIGVKHLGLWVNSIEEAKDWVECLGIPIEVPVTTGKTGIAYLFIKDPSGNLVELVEDRRGVWPPNAPSPAGEPWG